MGAANCAIIILVFAGCIFWVGYRRQDKESRQDTRLKKRCRSKLTLLGANGMPMPNMVADNVEMRPRAIVLRPSVAVIV